MVSTWFFMFTIRNADGWSGANIADALGYLPFTPAAELRPMNYIFIKKLVFPTCVNIKTKDEAIKNNI